MRSISVSLVSEPTSSPSLGCQGLIGVAEITPGLVVARPARLQWFSLLRSRRKFILWVGGSAHRRLSPENGR